MTTAKAKNTNFTLMSITIVKADEMKLNDMFERNQSFIPFGKNKAHTCKFTHDLVDEGLNIGILCTFPFVCRYMRHKIYVFIYAF